MHVGVPEILKSQSYLDIFHSNTPAGNKPNPLPADVLFPAGETVQSSRVQPKKKYEQNNKKIKKKSKPVECITNCMGKVSEGNYFW